MPAGGDAYVMKHIIHDWDDARAHLILRNIATAMGDKKGHVMLLESVIPEGARNRTSASSSTSRCWRCPAARSARRRNSRELFAAAGFELTRVVPTESPLSVVEAVRV